MTDLCVERTGGALVEFEMVRERFYLWFTNDAFVNELEGYVGAEVPTIPLMRFVDGTDCDPRWTWHVDPEDARFVDDWIDICDAWPSVIEESKSYYLGNQDFCPRQITVVAVTRRP